MQMNHFLKPLLGAALLTLFLSLWVGITEAQILDVQQKGSYLVVIGDQNRQVSSLPLGSNQEFLGLSSTFFVVRKGSYLYTYDERSRQIASMPMGSSDRFRSAAGNYFNLQKGSFIYTYDRHCKLTHTRSAN